MARKKAKGVDTRWLPAGTELIREGRVEGTLYVLLSGELAVYKGGEEINRISTPGDVIGELGALAEWPRTATVMAVSPAEVLAIRRVTQEILVSHPSVADKLAQALEKRFRVSTNKCHMYLTLIASLKRAILQDVLCELLVGGHSARNTPQEMAEAFHRSRIRKRMEERLAVEPDPDDPRVLERLASDYGVSEEYRARLAQYPWLDDALSERLRKLRNDWDLLKERPLPHAIREMARTVVQVMELLNEMEQMPGIRKEMEILRMENLVPFITRAETLKTIYRRVNQEQFRSEKDRFFHERKVLAAIQKARADAGSDEVNLYAVAKELGCETEYEFHIRSIVAMTDTPTDYVLPELRTDVTIT
ncbi:MAG: cyclic nucleotide-binding domain-containing protein [Candidatus Hydrogenedentota bacterium]|nr:MAG: cyclic nucleotide-binding domain-containing protein [Candidatus Hydrogenedentota bacterium]